MSLLVDIKSNNELISFHTPAHDENLLKDLYDCDVTELSYTDNLLNPQGSILDMQTSLAALYGAEACFFSANGATNNIHAAIYAVAGYGATLVVGNAHLSVYNGLNLANADCYHVDYLDADTAVPSSVKTVIFTSPDYYGNVYKTKDGVTLDVLAPLLRKKGFWVIVDASHGSHFIFNDKFPVSATRYADLVIHSLHKTLPVATGGSVLCVQNKELIDRCAFAQRLFHSTSPNFVTMCTADILLSSYRYILPKEYDKLFCAVKEFASRLDSRYKVIDNDDCSRVVIESPYDGETLNEYLLSRGFAAEMVSGDKVVLIVTPFNYRYLSLMPDVLNGIVSLKPYVAPPVYFTPHPNPSQITFSNDFELVEPKDACGRTLCGAVGIYPPGVPLLYSGDIITQNAVDLITNNLKRSFGLVNGLLPVVK